MRSRKHTDIQTIRLDPLSRNHLALRTFLLSEDNRPSSRALPWLSEFPSSHHQDYSFHWKWSAWFCPNQWLYYANNDLPRSTKPKILIKKNAKVKYTMSPFFIRNSYCIQQENGNCSQTRYSPHVEIQRTLLKCLLYWIAPIRAFHLFFQLIFVEFLLSTKQRSSY